MILNLSSYTPVADIYMLVVDNYYNWWTIAPSNV